MNGPTNRLQMLLGKSVLSLERIYGIKKSSCMICASFNQIKCDINFILFSSNQRNCIKFFGVS